MSLSDVDRISPKFVKAVAGVNARKNRSAPFSLRLSEEERARLEREAGSKPLGAYIRGKLLDRSNGSGLDYTALGQILGLLGKSDQASALCTLAVAAEAGRVMMGSDDCAALHEACSEVREIRLLLVKALGLRPPSSAKAMED